MKRLLLFCFVFILLIVSAANAESNRVTSDTLPDLSVYPWIYLRDGEPLHPEKDTVELLLVGDVSFGRETGDGYRPVNGDPLAEVAPWLRQADLAVANLESVLVPAGTPPGAPADAYLLRGQPGDALRLAAAGFDLVGVANNHAADYGLAGLAISNATLQRLGVAPVAAEPVIREIRGVSIAFLAFNQVLSASPSAPPPATMGEMISAVSAARARTDAVVVSLHWGYEYEVRPDPGQKRLARALRAAGAEVVVGHHPHVAQSIVHLDDGLVAYSLGNFLFDQAEGETGRGLALRLFLDRGGLRAAQALPLQAGSRPALLAASKAGSFLTRITPPPQRIGFVVADDELRRVSAAQQPANGLFWSGQADLTGDGDPEQVRREGERLRIYADGQLQWESPSTWQVADAALGDPNDDGRPELLLAVWKEDPAGHRRSHPYLVGYRAGEYTLMWGGRAVADPIAELEVADVDGDGRQELLVLLDPANGRGQVLAVWRWHGWGFGLLGKSPIGRSRDLIVLPGSAAEPPVISVALSSP